MEAAGNTSFWPRLAAKFYPIYFIAIKFFKN